MRIVQLITDRSRYVNPSKNYWFSFNAFLISLIGLYFLFLSFWVILVNTSPSGWSFSFRRLIHSLKTYDSTVLVYRQTKAEIVNTCLFIDKQRRICYHYCCMKRFWSSNLVRLANQKSTTSSCIDNFRFCLSINKNGRIIRFQWMNQTTKRKAPSGWGSIN
jgi:hypothetical protein